MAKEVLFGMCADVHHTMTKDEAWRMKAFVKEAQELAYDYKYIIMYHRALCKAKAKELLRQSEEEPVHKTRGRKKALVGPNELIETVLPTGGEEATNANVAPPVPVVSEPIISKEVYEAAQACLQGKR